MYCVYMLSRLPLGLDR